MVLKSLAKEMPVELVVSDVGNVMLLHKGELKRDYSWVQYDQEFLSMSLVTEDGEAQELGMTIHPPFHEALKKTKELFLVRVDDTHAPVDMRLLKFAKTVN